LQSSATPGRQRRTRTGTERPRDGVGPPRRRRRRKGARAHPGLGHHRCRRTKLRTSRAVSASAPDPDRPERGGRTDDRPHRGYERTTRSRPIRAAAAGPYPVGCGFHQPRRGPCPHHLRDVGGRLPGRHPRREAVEGRPEPHRGVPVLGMHVRLGSGRRSRRLSTRPRDGPIPRQRQTNGTTPNGEETRGASRRHRTVHAPPR